LKNSQKYIPDISGISSNVFFKDTFWNLSAITIGMGFGIYTRGILKLIAPKLGRLKNKITFAALFKENKWL